MKVNVTCAGCEVTVEEIDGKCVVIATQDGEIMEEFSVDCEETDEETEDEEIEDFDEDEDEDETEELEDDEVSESVKSFGDFFKS